MVLIISFIIINNQLPIEANFKLKKAQKIYEKDLVTSQKSYEKNLEIAKEKLIEAYNEALKDAMNKADLDLANKINDERNKLLGKKSKADPLSDNLILWWKFEEGSGRKIIDSAGNYDGTIVGDHDWGSSSDAKLGKRSIELMGNKDYIETPLQWAPEAFSVAFWIKADNHRNYNQNIGGEWGAFDFHTGKRGEIWVGLSSNYRFTNNDFGPDTLPLNKWTHFTFTYNNGTARFYKNGSRIGRVKTGWKNTGPWPYFRVGHDSVGAINGHVDDVRIYSKGLTASEVEAIYKLGE